MFAIYSISPCKSSVGVLKKYFFKSELLQLHKIHKKKPTHYEILGLNKGCSQADIKKSFIILSKQIHPDKQGQNSDNNISHMKFIELNEAYSVLSKPESRSLYDASLRANTHKNLHNYSGVQKDKIVYNDGTIYQGGNPKQKYYYGVSWLPNRLPNSYILAGVVGFMVIGAVFQYIIARMWTSMTNKQLESRSQTIARIYADIRRKATSDADSAAHIRKLTKNYKSGD